MGKGDRKTTKGKIRFSSYGNKRPHKVKAVKKTTGVKKVAVVAKPSMVRKPVAAAPRKRT